MTDLNLISSQLLTTTGVVAVAVAYVVASQMSDFAGRKSYFQPGAEL